MSQDEKKYKLTFCNEVNTRKYFRYASLFLQPVTDDIAPNYSKIVYRAMDLSLLKKNLETGVVSGHFIAIFL